MSRTPCLFVFLFLKKDKHKGITGGFHMGLFYVTAILNSNGDPDS